MFAEVSLTVYFNWMWGAHTHTHTHTQSWNTRISCDSFVRPMESRASGFDRTGIASLPSYKYVLASSQPPVVNADSDRRMWKSLSTYRTSWVCCARPAGKCVLNRMYTSLSNHKIKVTQNFSLSAFYQRVKATKVHAWWHCVSKHFRLKLHKAFMCSDRNGTNSVSKQCATRKHR